MRKLILCFMAALMISCVSGAAYATQLPETTDQKSQEGPSENAIGENEIKSTEEDLTQAQPGTETYHSSEIPTQSSTNAEESDTSEKKESDSETTVESGADLQNLLYVDDENVYDGMTQAYKNGYEPSVSNNTATVIVPFISDESIDISSIKITPDLGATENSPFVYKNYQITVKRTSEKINGGSDESPVFLVRFDFELQSERYNGVYPVILTVNYTYEGMSLSQTFTTYIRITDGKSTEAETEPVAAVETEADPTSEPKVIIQKCTDMPEKLQSGDEFSFKAILKNTNKLKYVQNMTVTVSTSADTLSLSADSNVFYYEYLGTEASLEVPLTFKCSDSAAAGKYTVTLDMSYDNPDASSLTATGKIEINISQKMEVDLEVGNIASEVNAGDSLSFTVQALNLGRGKVYNARCQVDVPGLTADKSLFLGNMEGGSAASGEISAFAGMVNADASSDSERYGTTIGTVILTYEDENGQEYTVTEEVKLKINPLAIHSGLNTAKDEDSGIGKQLIIGTAIVLALAGGGTGIPLLIRHRKKRNRIHDELG